MGRLSDVLLLDEPIYPEFPGYQNQDTSREAAAKIAPKAKTVRDKILAAIREAGEDGLTADQAGEKVGVDPFVSRPRCTELKAMGLIRRSLNKRRPSSNGSSSIADLGRICTKNNGNRYF
ncbi:MAG: hypothetical protein KGL39_06280 [Patescibacteria group bacterium]|nr:hypothetical protein [Patescibacteria group bacterium]